MSLDGLIYEYISKCQAKNTTLSVSTTKQKDEPVSLWRKMEMSLTLLSLSNSNVL